MEAVIFLATVIGLGVDILTHAGPVIGAPRSQWGGKAMGCGAWSC